MVEHGAYLEDNLVGNIGKERDAEDRHLEDPKDGGIEDFPPVEAEGGGDVHIRVDMVDVVKAPEQGIFMVDFMPVIKGPVQKEEAKDELEPAGQGDHIAKGPGGGPRPSQRRPGRCSGRLSRQPRRP